VGKPQLDGRKFVHYRAREIHGRAWAGAHSLRAERYKIRDTYFIDALSYYTIRNDWDRDRPASGVKNLADGRYK